jgi:hypothetical protein
MVDAPKSTACGSLTLGQPLHAMSRELSDVAKAARDVTLR